jgi:hypothetical protein
MPKTESPPREVEGEGESSGVVVVFMLSVQSFAVGRGLIDTSVEVRNGQGKV